jgi:protein SMG6
MDDVILRAVAWQKDHFTSRLGIVNPTADRRAVPQDVANVVLLTGDRNLRLKARARGLDASASSLLDAQGSNGNG